ncbi:isocitrate dehydrogenase kinase/phosphatase AceK regulatory subunit, partial [Anaeromyxobacter sp. SG26]|uniref:isocitrate dehydrogenase kinase/phosphatase AceK regulatory subunit n=1 Tax=Anaeromyxobacter sp. SG26 TaxID=2925407 RepID=UPI001F5A5060
RGRFEAKDWAGGQADARERLDLRDRLVNACVGTVRAELGAAACTPAQPAASAGASAMIRRKSRRGVAVTAGWLSSMPRS